MAKKPNKKLVAFISAVAEGRIFGQMAVEAAQKVLEELRQPAEEGHADRPDV